MPRAEPERATIGVARNVRMVRDTIHRCILPGHRFPSYQERRIRMRPSTMAFVFALSLGLAVFVQPAAAQADASAIIAVGEMAPDITVTGATRYGVLQDPVRLSDLRGEVVVIAFFFRARTPG